MIKASGEYYDLIAPYWYLHKFFYKEGFRFIDSLRKKHHLNKDILEVACGTGNLLALFEKAKYQTYGSDLSAGMLAIAKKQLKKTVFKKQAFQHVSFGRKFSIIVSFFNSFSYCTTKTELKNTLAHLRKQLKPNGLLIFDLFINTKKPKEEFGVRKWSVGKTQVTRTFHGYPQGNKWISEMHYLIIDKGKTKTITAKTVCGIFSKQDVIKCIKKTGLKLVYAGKAYMPASGITFVAQKL